LAQDFSLAQKFLSIAKSQDAASALADPSLRIAQSGTLQIVYAPFDYVETRARLVVVGITPGMTQAINAMAAAQRSLRNGETLETALSVAKLTGSFSGALRSNLVSMLDAIGVARLLGQSSTASLFDAGSTAIHFTSALRYPVFVDSMNYNGSPDMLTTPLLKKMVETHLAEEARLLPTALWLPLGPKADSAVRHLARAGEIDGGRILSGMPHPSGANAERVAVFLGRKAAALASTKTNPATLLSAFSSLNDQVARLEREAA
jgi:hypothetical protein